MTESLVTPRQSNDQLSELLSLIADADTVELKLTVPDSSHRPAADALELDPLNAEIRQVVFFDTPDLALDKQGVVVRARRIQGGRGDTVVKLRPVVPGQLPEDLRERGKVGVEVDAMPGGFVCSASMKGETTAKAVRRVALGDEGAAYLLSKAQRAFYKTHSTVPLEDLVVLGPINIFKLKFIPPDLGRKMVAELWLYPDGVRILELSTKCAPWEAFQVAAETRVFLSSLGIDLDGQQQTKTRTALEFFAAVARSRAADESTTGAAPEEA